MSTEFFPIGLYCVNTRYPFSNSIVEEFPEIAKAGFNFIQSYQFEAANYDFDRWNTEEAAIEYLDAAHNHGLKVLMGLPIGLADDTMEQDLAFIQKRVAALKDHPALFGWQLYDEPSTANPQISPKNLKMAYSAIKVIDPMHPVTIAEALSIHDEYSQYPIQNLEAFDILMPDWASAIPLPDIHVIRRENLAKDISLLTARGKSVINHVNVYNLAKDQLTCPLDEIDVWPECAINRYPTKEEMRFMAYDSIILGAKGVSFLCYRFNYDENDVGDDISPQANPTQWARIKAVVSELKEMSPILLAPNSDKGAVIDPENSGIEFMVRDYQDKLYLIATNPSADEKTVTFVLSELPTAIEVVSESRSIIPKGKSFTDNFDEYAVHIYEIST